MSGESRLVQLRREVDVYAARAQARALARAMGFDAYACTEIETAVSELCSNVIRYGSEGLAVLRALPGRFEVVCTDRGPGFRGGGAPPHPEGLGIGLAGAARLLDELELGDLPGGGGRVVGRKRLPGGGAVRRPPGAGAAGGAAAGASAEGRGSWVTHAALRPRPGEVESGDAFVVVEEGGGLLVGVIDGLGHGPDAAQAARVAAERVRAHPGEPLTRLLARAHEAARSTRGAAAVLVRLPATGGGAVYASVGNAGGRVLPGGEPLVPQPGCLGVRLPAVVERPLELTPGRVLLLWTDGFQPPEALPELPVRPAERLAEALEGLLARFALPRDDALVLAASRPAGA